MDQAGVVRTLAEPTLTAISGEFRALPGRRQLSVSDAAHDDWRPARIPVSEFGVSLTFSPVVLSEGRISLTMLTEVSQLDPQNSVTVAGTTVPGLNVRRADTTVEIPSGGTLAIAGMIQDQTKQQITGFPGLMQVPILGPLFKSRDYLNNRTELVVLVTPYVVRAVAERICRGPTRGSPIRAIRRRSCSAISTASMASAAACRHRRKAIAANMASSSIDADRRRRSMHHIRTMIGRRAARGSMVLRVALAVGCAAIVCGCNTDRELTGVPEYSGRLSDATPDHALGSRPHPQGLHRDQSRVADRGAAGAGARLRGKLEERSDRRRDRRFAGREQQRTRIGRRGARDRFDPGRDRRAAAKRGGPQLPGHRPHFCPVRITYPKVVAQAGPCGLWPQDIGPSFNRTYSENLPDWNFGCATQRNLASMVDNPSDLVQPRPETPAYAMRRTTVIEKYRQGAATSNSVLSSGAGKITSVGQ